MIKFRLTILLLCLITLSGAQNDALEIRDLFLKSQKFYESKDAYLLDIEYTLYKSETGDDQLEHYLSETIKNGQDFYTKIHNTEFVELGNKSLKINHDERAVLIDKRESKVASIGVIDNILAILPKFKSYKVTKNNDGFKCEFTAHDITQLPFTKVIIYFNKDYSLKSQILHLTNALPYVENDKNVYRSPRLEIKLSAVKQYITDEKLKLTTYLKANDLARLSGKFSKYQLISNL